MIWRTKKGELDLSKQALVMGILNVTVDSFSDGGKFVAVDAAVAHGLEMVAQGAQIIDVGGESTRPGAEPVPVEEELLRVLPVVAGLAGKISCEISIDTSKSEVARAAVECGATIINDVTGLRDPAMRAVARATGAGVIAMHMQGTPRDMQRAPYYQDVITEIREFFRHTFEAAVASGLDPMCLAFDPGIGFGKTMAHHLALLQNLAAWRMAERPLVIGVSRKSFLGQLVGTLELEARFWPTVALTSFLREQGVNVVRVHDVQANAEALRMTEAILAA